jgi:hypothetical protein
VSFFGCLGYELDLKHLLKLEREEIRQQIAFYKTHREVFQFGTFHRLAGGWQVTHGVVTLAAAFRSLLPAAPNSELILFAPGFIMFPLIFESFDEGISAKIIDAEAASAKTAIPSFVPSRSADIPAVSEKTSAQTICPNLEKIPERRPQIP